VLSDIGLSICPVRSFTDRREAARFLQQHRGRHVLKISGGYDTFVGQLEDGRDVLAFLNGLSDADAQSVILMAHVDGIEMGVGAYFNGERFLMPPCLDWEHKRFFPGDLGELTGEMGTVVTYDRTKRFHERTLGRMEPLLRQHGYCGYINLNTIVNEDGIWPLEFTCRFGYPGYAILDSIQETPWAGLFRRMITRSHDRFATRPGFSAGIVMTTPPFPYSRAEVKVPVGLPVVLEGLSDDDRRQLHYGEVGLQNGQLVTSGAYGWTMVVTGVAPSIAQAREAANRLAGRVVIPNVRYRRDIGDRLIAGDFARVEALGLLDEPDGRSTVAQSVQRSCEQRQARAG